MATHGVALPAQPLLDRQGGELRLEPGAGAAGDAQRVVTVAGRRATAELGVQPFDDLSGGSSALGDDAEVGAAIEPDRLPAQRGVRLEADAVGGRVLHDAEDCEECRDVRLGLATDVTRLADVPVVGKLGSGGTSTVFLAEDRKNAGRNVALKILKPAVAREEKTLKNFLREAELLKKFAHPNLVKGYDYGTSGPLTYLVLEYLEGESVLDIIEREKQLPEARALGILVEAAKALSYITGNGIIHRDIKPDNLMVTKDNRLVLCDLGFAIPMNRDSNGATDDEETTSGTVQYMSPEQARGQRDLDVRTDIYALGATLYHMIVGKVPFQGEDSMEIMSKQVMESLNSSQIKNRRISRHTHYFIERMMSKDKDLRYASPDELVKDVTEQMEGFQSLEYRAPEEKSDSKVLGGLAGKKAKITFRPRVKTKMRSSREKKRRR